MDQKPLLTTNFALARTLKELALRLGLDDGLADAIAQVHLQQTQIPRRWGEFLSENCIECVHSPESCVFLNPRVENCAGSATPESTRAAVAVMIETRRLTSCPARVAS